MPASDKTPSKRVTVADVAARLDGFMEMMTDIATQQDEIVGRLDAQRDGLMAAEARLDALDDPFPDKPVMKFDSTPIMLQAEMEPDENACSIEELMNGGNVVATEALKFPTHEELRSQLSEVFAETPEGAEQLYTLLGDERTEQAILRVATRLYHLDRAEDIMKSQPQDRDRSQWVADARTDEAKVLWPLLYQWAREKGWL